MQALLTPAPRASSALTLATSLAKEARQSAVWPSPLTALAVSTSRRRIAISAVLI